MTMMMMMITTILVGTTHADNTPFPIAADRWGNVIPDFSFAGYQGGGVELPQAPLVIRLEACTKHPATCSKRDDSRRIQQAINQVAARAQDTRTGLRGAVVLARGTYYIRSASPLYLNESGVVLRGEGDRESVLVAGGTQQRPLIQVGCSRPEDRRYQWTAPAPRSTFTRTNSRPPIYPMLDTDPVPVGATQFRVQAGIFQPGDRIVLTRPSSPAWITGRFLPIRFHSVGYPLILYYAIPLQPTSLHLSPRHRPPLHRPPLHSTPPTSKTKSDRYGSYPGTPGRRSNHLMASQYVYVDHLSDRGVRDQPVLQSGLDRGGRTVLHEL